MCENQNLTEQLSNLLHWKQSKKFYAEKLGITEDDVDEILKTIRKKSVEKVINSEEGFVKKDENLKDKTAEVTYNFKNEIKTLDELIKKCDIDTSLWEITRYVQNYWGNNDHPHWQVKAFLRMKNAEQLYQDGFIEFLSTYEPSASDIPIPKFSMDKQWACLLINKQDAHINREDFGGENCMLERMDNIYDKTETIIHQAELSNNLEDIIYVLGSDEFNSEWTQQTTKGTPQNNILSYHEAFEQICSHEVKVITMMLQHSENVEIVFVPGNHDEYAGWHLVNWLKTYFRFIDRITFDISPKYRKYISYGKCALMFNHGDSIKPEKLASIFPIEYRENWSEHEYFYIFSGDLHHEISRDFNGIKFYRLPAFTTASSKWEDKNGYVGAKAEVNAFLIDEVYGITNIFKQYL